MWETIKHWERVSRPKHLAQNKLVQSLFCKQSNYFFVRKKAFKSI